MNNASTRWSIENLGLVELAATWWLQASILLTIGLLAAKLLHRPVWQSLVIRITLASVLLSPLLAQLLSLSGWPALTLDIHSRLLSQPTATTASDPFAELNSSHRGAIGEMIDPIRTIDEQTKVVSLSAEPSITANSGGEFANGIVDRSSDRQPTIASAGLPPTISSETPPSSFKRQLFYYGWLALTAWAVGAAVLLARLLFDLTHSQSMRRQSEPADEQCKAVCQRIAKRLNLRRKPEVRINPFLSSPCLIGHWRPSILLPEDIDPASYDQIFLHELAHLHRGDWLWCGVGHVARALLWCQPLIWWLHRQNLSVAEEICDDYVIQHGCSRESYLQQLIQIAERSLPNTRPVGVSMVGFRSKLGRRAVRIVDTTRSLSTRAGKLFVASALLSTLSLTLSVALIEVGQSGSAIAEQQPGTSRQTSTTSANATNEDSQLSNAAATNAADEEQSDSDNVSQNDRESSGNTQRTFRGRVLDSDGKPVAGATVSAVNQQFIRDENRWRNLEPLSTTLSAADGKYTLTCQLKEEDHSLQLMATLDGYAPDSVGMVTLWELNEQNNSRLDLKLARQKLIQGRIVDMEGNTVPKVKVEIVNVVLPTDDGAVEQWIANAKPDLLKGHDDYVMMSHDPRVTETQFPGRSNLDGVVFNSGVVETNATGEFQLSGIGENYLVHVRLSGPTIATRDALIVARDMPSLLAFNHEVRNNDFTHYGASPTIVVSSSQPITGVVVDADSGEPLKYMRVVLTRVGKSNWYVNKIATSTDQDGRFQLSGAPLGGGHMLEVQPGLEQPYFNTQLELPVTSSSKPLECKFELQKTKWITGRITNESGDPVVAFLNYYPYRNNIHAEKYSNFEQRITGRAANNDVRSSADGRFRIKAIPGPAVLAACVANREDQPKYIPNRAEGLLERIGGEQMSKLFDSWSADYFDAMVEIDIDPAADEVTRDLTFKYGSKRELRVLDTDGAAVQTVAVLGTTFPPRYDRDHKLDESKLEIMGLQPNEKRLLVLMSANGSSGKLITIHATDSEVSDVQLEQCATVTGQVLDQDAQPVANLQVHISPMQEPSQDNWSRELGPVVTDAKGQFQLQLATGGLYRLWSYTSTGPNFQVTVRPAAGATYQLSKLTDGMELTEQDAAKFLQSTNP